MATIFYSMSGEGRGHATRVKAIAEDLRTRHRVVLFAPPQAADLLVPVFSGSDVEIRPIEGLRFAYRPDGRVGYFRSLSGAVGWYRRLASQLDALQAQWSTDSPDLVITDFDPVLPRLARRMGIPFVSIDHQHFLSRFSTAGLPFRLRIRAAAMAPFVEAFHRGQELTIVSSFHRPPPSSRPGPGVRAVGVLLGSDIRHRTPVDDGFLLAYLRRDPPPRVLETLARVDREVRIYGPAREGRWGNLHFRRVERSSFVDDLASCSALVTTAGNQLVGEAIHLRKPVLALPEPGNWEQEINGFHLERLQAGMSLGMDRFDRHSLQRFLDRVDEYRAQALLLDVCGNGEVSSLVEEQLAKRHAIHPGAWRVGRAAAAEAG